MGHLDARLRHGGQDRGRRRRRGGHHPHPLGERAALVLAGVQDHLHDDGRAAQVAYPVLGQGRVDRPRLDLAQAHVGPGQCRNGPGEAPAVAVEHGQGPEVDRMRLHAPGQDVAERVQVGAAVVVDHALGVARGARGVVERDRLPLVGRWRPGVVRVALGQEGLVVDLAEALAAALGGGQRVVDIDDQDLAPQVGERRLDAGGEGGVGNERLGLAVCQDEADGRGVQADVERVEHGARHGHPVVRLEHGRRVRCHDRDAVANADAPRTQRRGEAPAAGVGLGPALAMVAVDERRMLREDLRRAGHEAEWAQRGIVGRGLGEFAGLRTGLGHDGRTWPPWSFGAQPWGAALGRAKALM